MTVYVYGIFFANSKYCYIGSSIHPYQRYYEHIKEVESDACQLFKHRVWRKHGVDKFVVFKRTTDEEHRVELEQEYYDFFARRGWQLVNACRPDQSKCVNHGFIARLEYHQILSEGQRRRYRRPECKAQSAEMHSNPEYLAKLRESNRRTWSNPEIRKRHSELMHNLFSTEEHRLAQSKRSKEIWLRPGYRSHMSMMIRKSFTDDKRKQYSEQSKALWQNEEFRQKMSSYEVRMAMSESQNRYLDSEDKRKQRSAHLNNVETNAKRKQAYAGERYKQKRATCSEFRRTYGTSKVWHFKYTTGEFTPAMHFIIVNDIATIFLWDSRKILKQIDANEIPEGAIRAYDNYKLLVQ